MVNSCEGIEIPKNPGVWEVWHGLHHLGPGQTSPRPRIGLHPSQTDETEVSHVEGVGLRSRRAMGGGSGRRSKTEEIQQGCELPVDGGRRVFKGGVGDTHEAKDGASDVRGVGETLCNKQEIAPKTADGRREGIL